MGLPVWEFLGRPLGLPVALAVLACLVTACAQRTIDSGDVPRSFPVHGRTLSSPTHCVRADPVCAERQQVARRAMPRR